MRDAMAHSRDLESQIEQHRQLHRERLQDFSLERCRLAGEIKALRDGLAAAEAKMAQAEEGAARWTTRRNNAIHRILIVTRLEIGSVGFCFDESPGRSLSPVAGSRD